MHAFVCCMLLTPTMLRDPNTCEQVPTIKTVHIYPSGGRDKCLVYCVHQYFTIHGVYGDYGHQGGSQTFNDHMASFQTMEWNPFRSVVCIGLASSWDSCTRLLAFPWTLWIHGLASPHRLMRTTGRNPNGHDSHEIDGAGTKRGSPAPALEWAARVEYKVT